MKSLRHILMLALVSVLFTACRREQSSSEHAEQTQAPVRAEETHEEEQNAIHLSDDMVRDLRISTAAAAERSGAEEVSVLGEVAADQSRYAEVAPPTSGQIVRVLVEQNAVVKEGSPLAQLRSTELGRARADLLSAEAHRDLARQTVDRKRTLANERIVAAREAQEAEAAFRAAEAEVRAATAALHALGEAAHGSGTPELA